MAEILKQEFDEKGNKIYVKYSDGNWVKKDYDKNGNEVYFESSNDYWIKREYDENGNKVYYEDSVGRIRDNREKKSCIVEYRVYPCDIHKDCNYPKYVVLWVEDIEKPHIQEISFCLSNNKDYYSGDILKEILLYDYLGKEKYHKEKGVKSE